MNKKSWLVIGITFLSGIIIQLYAGDYKNEPDFLNEMVVLLSGGLAFLIYVITIPMFVSLIVAIQKKAFPNKTFTGLMYAFLIGLFLIMMIGTYTIKQSM